MSFGPYSYLNSQRSEVTLTALRIDTQLCCVKDSVVTRWCLTVSMPHRDKKREKMKELVVSKNNKRAGHNHDLQPGTVDAKSTEWITPRKTCTWYIFLQQEPSDASHFSGFEGLDEGHFSFLSFPCRDRDFHQISAGGSIFEHQLANEACFCRVETTIVKHLSFE